MTRAEGRALALQIAWKLYGLPYMWGGDDPLKGFDCSGMVIEILKSIGILPFKGDWTAAGLWERFQDWQKDTAGPGRLVFWSYAGGPPYHIEMCLNEELSIGASGGGRKTRTEQDAVEQNAYIKIRPIQGRGDVKGYCDPFLCLRE